MLQDNLRKYNPWWDTGKVDPRFVGVPRDLVQKILLLFKMQHIKDIVGVRRCGKTTVLYQLIAHLLEKGVDPNEIVFLNFDDVEFSSAKFDELSDAMDIINPDFKYLFIDEVQQKTDWERWIRTMYDLKRFDQIFVSGSSASVLSREIGRVLTGRHLTCKLYPFSFKEYLLFKGWTDFRETHILHERGRIKHHLENYLTGGGFPDGFRKEGLERREFFTNLFNDIVTRDIATRNNSRLDKSKNMSYYLISNSCKEFSLRRISDSLNISMDATSSYLEQITESEMVHILSMFSYKLRHQFKQNKKVYCVDTGLMNNISFMGEDPARMAETTVYLELLRREKEVFYWKGERGHEVDFVVKGKRPELFQVCIEMKRSETKSREVGGLLECMEHFGLEEATVITTVEEKEEIVGGMTIRYRPLWRFLMDL